MKYTTLFSFNFLFSLFIERERERERDKGGETVLLVSCQCEGIGNGSAEAEDMSEKVVKEGSANADLKADVQNDQQQSDDQQADCGKRVRQRGSRRKKKLLRLPFIPLKDLKPYLKLN